MTEDQNWTSQRAQDFWRDIDAGRTHGVPADDLWGPLPDDDDGSSSESDEDDAGGCEMPGPFISKPGDPLPFCGLLEPLDVSSPALDTLANCLHSIATIRDQ